MAKELEKAYSHRDIEGKWYASWVESGFFQPFPSAKGRFSMVIPPPNVTGSLHIGHALNNTLQDILCRYKRMDGCSVLWVPGTDHAGIATQNVVERQLAEEGLSRTQLGRAKFVERVWAWREQSGRTILRQLRALGASCDWSRERFTMDEGLSLAVREAFVKLWEDGLLYRAERLINWCPRCKTALADIEVVHEEVAGHLWHIRYPSVDAASDGVIVATTRPETMLGDTAVAVHPEDQRYHGIIGKRVRLPIVGREIPVIADSFVDPTFGTGALKITPGHDFNDFEIGEKYGLQKISIFDEGARIRPSAFTENGQEPAWLSGYRLKDRFEARSLIIEELKEKGLLEKVEAYRLSLGRCYRCQTVVEPYLTPQWYVRIKPLAGPAIDAVREGRVRIIPEGWANSYFAWMENIKDWCISRQIWWGHQIPAWYCVDCDSGHLIESGQGDFMLSKEARPIVARQQPEKCARCGGNRFIRDPDVLDTWFSSALWPFSTLGWPSATEDLKAFYPTSVLVTSFDILFFWVARMIMMGLKFMGEVPFRDVYIHALVRDQEGQKMSKSKGNVIDPLEVMERYGTDAFRFTLAALTAVGRDVKLAEERISGYQNFVNKLWNATRFVLLNLSEEARSEPEPLGSLQQESLNLADRWILSRLVAAAGEAREAIEAYRFNEFAHHLYQFVWHEFCDWYIEMSKLSLNGMVPGDPKNTQKLLKGIVEKIALLLHPLMPFVTEEIWQTLSGIQGGRGEAAPGSDKRSVMVQPYPRPEPGWRNPEAERNVGFLIEIIRAIRNLRSEMNCPPSKQVKVILSGPETTLAFVRAQEPYVKVLARAASVEYLSDGERPKGAATAVVQNTEIYLPFGDMIDLDEEKARLSKEVRKVEEKLSRVQTKLANRQFLDKAREEVIRKEREKAEQFREKITTLTRSLERIREIQRTGDDS
ncbi:MAG: valine--tRNA ligase [Deltaproteobacteria bacterium]|nr:valine--tRNA ligase [Deltaproteobacteria bacterium]